MITFSDHALERCAERGITQEQALDVIEKMLGPEEERDRWPQVTMEIRKNGLTVVYNHARKVIVTVARQTSVSSRGRRTKNKQDRKRAKGRNPY